MTNKICGHCTNWRCDDLLHLIGHCTINRMKIFYGTMCDTCTKYQSMRVKDKLNNELEDAEKEDG